jgi:phosphopantetheinyl transferase (holo-ACP synthase)
VIYGVGTDLCDVRRIDAKVSAHLFEINGTKAC